MLFLSAKVSHLAHLPQGEPERKERVRGMVAQHDREGFGHCTNINECEAACPKEISVTHIAQLNRDFVAKGLLDYTGSDWQAKLKTEYTDPLTTIGGQQDEMVGECRWVVKALRQKAAILMATDPAMAPIAAVLPTALPDKIRSHLVSKGGV